MASPVRERSDKHQRMFCFHQKRQGLYTNNESVTKSVCGTLSSGKIKDDDPTPCMVADYDVKWFKQRCENHNSKDDTTEWKAGSKLDVVWEPKEPYELNCFYNNSVNYNIFDNEATEDVCASVKSGKYEHDKKICRVDKVDVDWFKKKCEIYYDPGSDTGVRKSSDGRYLLHDDENTGDRFEFFQCDTPPKGYKTSSKDHLRGQIRSEKHPDKCLTVGGVDNRPHIIYNPDLPDGRKDGGFEKKNGILSLEPCSEDPRLQWWELYYNSTHYIGSEEDTERPVVDGTYKHRVLYSYSVKNPEKAPFHTGYGAVLQFF
ncbi:hypothetical protein MCAP1_002469 [Malassezia caprae]|uniref:Uncharacterized protein n=1 Tax=Malassezia caprae TaxID=1381934 RepID=A0AAF0E9E8_9BASI|nr:hypothetical protein MCAP1_002469 [Malassezia caprae]